jgi:CBS domain-containing membrane protein
MNWQVFQPRMAGAHLGDRLTACLGATLCIFLTIVACAWVPLSGPSLPVILAPLGASAATILVIPASPLAQPLRVVAGNVISALVGVTLFKVVPDQAVAAGLAVGAATLAMSLARCFHPPGAAVALTAVMGTQDIHAAGYALAFMPVGVNSIALVGLAMAFHRFTGHTYPHRALDPTAERTAAGFRPEDFDQALEDMHETFDISREDLELLLSRAELHAAHRLQRTRPARRP